jgi:ABC-type polysaccharide/polyol phosphate export permease
MPLAIIGFLLMIIHKITIKPDIVSMLPLFLIVLVFFTSMYITFKSISVRYKKFKKEIDEIAQLERD